MGLVVYGGISCVFSKLAWAFALSMMSVPSMTYLRDESSGAIIDGFGQRLPLASKVCILVKLVLYCRLAAFD